MQQFIIELGTVDGIPRLTQNQFVAQEVTTLFAKRGTKVPYGVQFSRNGVLELLPASSLLRFSVKPSGEYDATAVVAAWDTDWTTPGSAAGFYTATVNFNTSELNSLMLSPDGNPLNDVPTLDLIGAFSWGLSGVEPTETAEFTVTVANLINDESTSPPTAAGIHPATLNTLGYTGGGTTNLDGIPTVGLTTPSFIAFFHATDGLRFYTLQAGTTAASSPDIIHPTDYNASTNAKIWISAL